MNKMMVMMLALLTVILYSSLSCAVLRDPTQPPSGIEAQRTLTPGDLVLTGIVISPNRSVAVINGLNKSVGDEIVGLRIVKIYANTVELAGPSGKISLLLSGQPVKRLLPMECKRDRTIC
jgi:hypothetical protein